MHKNVHYTNSTSALCGDQSMPINKYGRKRHVVCLAFQVCSIICKVLVFYIYGNSGTISFYSNTLQGMMSTVTFSVKINSFLK